MVLKDDVNKALDSIRPYLQADNGDVELVDITVDGIVKVRLTGACDVCPLSVITLRAGIERSLLIQVPGIKRVESVTL
jgi:Fe-S cluster biogenesis protein NfuA